MVDLGYRLYAGSNEGVLLKWPWVSRVMHEQYVAHLQHCFDTTQARYHELLDKYHALKLNGAVAPSGPPELLPDQPKREPTIVSQVIREQSGGDPRLAAHLRTYAGKLKREGADENQIAYALGQWVSTEPDTQVI